MSARGLPSISEDIAMSTMTLASAELDFQVLARHIDTGQIIPYLGPGMLDLCPGHSLPSNSLALAAQMVSKVSVPHKIRQRLTQAAQFIENFKHRKTVVHLMNQAFDASPEPSALHLALAASGAGMWVDTWYDNTFANALLRSRPQGGWLQIQGLSQAEHFGRWTGIYADDGEAQAELPQDPGRLLYRPIGGRQPAGNYLVSDSDYVEVLTEIDIQTPIPQVVQNYRSGRNFLFLGCRFDDQLTRSFARQIMKRSSDLHWAVLPHEPTRMEARFLEEQRIQRIPMELSDFAPLLVEALQPALTT
jgi:hypothetical protein